MLIRERLRELHSEEWDDAEWEEAEAQLVAEGAIRHLPPSFDEIGTWGEPPAVPDVLDPVVDEIIRRRR